MRKIVRKYLPLLLAILAPVTAFALDYSLMLEQSEAASLPPEALAHYEEAAFFNERAAYEIVVVKLDEAAREAPNHIPIQFLTLQRARDRAEVYYSGAIYAPAADNMDYTSPPWRTAEPMIDIAEQAASRLLANPELSIEEKRRVERDAETLRELKNTISERDRARLEAGDDVVQEKLKYRQSYLGFDTVAEAARELPGAPAPTPPPGGVTGPPVTEVDPFELLPGEVVQDFLPPPPPPQPGTAAGPGAPGVPPGAPQRGNPQGAPQRGNPQGAPQPAAPQRGNPFAEPAVGGTGGNLPPPPNPEQPF